MLSGKLSADNVIGLASSADEVHGNGGKLRGSSALKEQNFVIVRNVHQLAQTSLCTADDGIIFRGTV